MLLKVFKHDFKTASRYELPILIGLLLATVVGCVDIFILGSVVNGNTENSGIVQMIGMIVGAFGTFMGILAVAAVCSIMMFMLYYRFYKSMITDEAYLTLTLPVSPTKLLLGKLFSSLLWMIISMVAVLVAFFVIFSCLFSIIEGAPSFGELFSEMFETYRLMGVTAANVIGYSVCLVISSVSGLLQVFMAILFAGSIVKKHKALAAIGLVFGINFVVSTLSQIVVTIISVIYAASAISLGTAPASLWAFDMTIWVQTIIYAGLGVLFFFISRYLIKNKVNLE